MWSCNKIVRLSHEVSACLYQQRCNLCRSCMLLQHAVGHASSYLFPSICFAIAGKENAVVLSNLHITCRAS